MATATNEMAGPHPRASPSPNRYWDEWNQTWRFRDDCDDFMAKQLDVALAVARRVGLRDARILDVGCGTGWLGQALLPFGRVSGIDFSPASIAAGSLRYPELTLICGDFLEVSLGEQFDFVVSADALPHMPDHEAFFHRVGALLKPEGTLLLMTMNPQVWCRRSVLVEAPDYLAHASTDEWPTLGRIRKLLRPSFTVQQVTSMDPGGDLGLLWWVENRYVRGGMNRLLGAKRWRSLLERAGFGRDLIVVARRR